MLQIGLITIITMAFVFSGTTSSTAQASDPPSNKEHASNDLITSEEETISETPVSELPRKMKASEYKSQFPEIIMEPTLTKKSKNKTYEHSNKVAYPTHKSQKTQVIDLSDSSRSKSHEKNSDDKENMTVDKISHPIDKQSIPPTEPIPSDQEQPQIETTLSEEHKNDDESIEVDPSNLAKNNEKDENHHDHATTDKEIMDPGKTKAKMTSAVPEIDTASPAIISHTDHVIPASHTHLDTAPITNKGSSKNNPIPSSTQISSWSYSGPTGPQHWGDLNPEYQIAKFGRQQSPIDLSDPLFSVRLKPLQIDYGPTPLSILNTAHTIQVNIKSDCKATMNGKEYSLKHFNFRAPSEHTWNGKHFDMEMHFVHEDSEGQIAIIGLLVQQGETNATLAKLWENLPSQANETVEISEQQINPSVFFPSDLRYFSYEGSLTTPPCTEGVSWIILARPITVSEEQIKNFTSLIPKNNRPVQSLYSRIVRATP